MKGGGEGTHFQKGGGNLNGNIQGAKKPGGIGTAPKREKKISTRPPWVGCHQGGETLLPAALARGNSKVFKKKARKGD